MLAGTGEPDRVLPVARHKTEPAAEEIAVRAAIQEIASEHRRHYGYRRITAELRYRGMVVNRKRVLRMMQDDNLLAIRRRKFISTTDSQHSFEVMSIWPDEWN